MIQEVFEKAKRELKAVKLQTQLAVVGGGLAGVCAAIAAAREGIKVTLIQDRPVLGGNASSEVRLWVLGATSHMGNNNRWSREGSIIDEILVENVYRNKEGNPLMFDTILMEKILAEKNIHLLLNTAVFELKKSDERTVSLVRGFNSQNYTIYDISASLFCDASGDGIVAYMAGAAFRIGAEEENIYGEKFAPHPGEYGELLGHSIYFYSKDTGKPVKFVAPSFALKDITKIPRWNRINPDQHGCKFWWLEYGGRMDTVHDTESIKYELWSVVYGVWNYIKNSGKFPQAENMTLEWVGVIPGKRESRRFVGHYTMTQQDIIEQRHHNDAIAFGGWAIDLHPADGVYSHENGCIQYHSKGIYEIPYRSYVSKDLDNLFFAGRNVSASHVAHGSTRVMATAALGGVAVGMAAAQCIHSNLFPADIIEDKQIKILQHKLNVIGQSIPNTKIEADNNLASKAKISASSSLDLNLIPFNGSWYKLDYSVAQMLPMVAGQKYTFEIEVDAEQDTTLLAELRYSGKPNNYTPDQIAEQLNIPLTKGKQNVSFSFNATLPNNQYGFVCFIHNENVKIRMSDNRYTGIVSVFNKFNYDVNNTGKQNPPEGLGIDSFEFWCPDRRPAGYNLAMSIKPSISFKSSDLINGFVRPTSGANAWLASLEDKNPTVTLRWDTPQAIGKIILYFDTDYDHAMESVQMGHPENIMPFCIREYQILDVSGNLLHQEQKNHQTRNQIVFSSPVYTQELRIEVKHPSENVPASIFQVYIECSN